MTGTHDNAGAGSEAVTKAQIRASGYAVVTLFGLGAAAGVAGTALHGGFTLFLGGAMGAFLLLAIFSAYKAHHHYGLSLTAEKVAPSIQRARKVLIVGSLLGGVLGALLGVGAVSLDSNPFSNGTLPPAIAILCMAGWIIAAPVMTIIWLRSIDEHELQANNWGATAGIMLYFMIEPAWWLGWRGGIFPRPEGMIIFAAVLTVYTAVWGWRRSR
jgi:hypothetical protein